MQYPSHCNPKIEKYDDIEIWPKIIGSTLLNAHFLRFWAEITGWCGAMGQILQMGGTDTKTYPSKPSETQVWFLKTALSRRRISESHFAKNTVFLPKNALFDNILHCNGLCGSGNDDFLFANTFNIPLDPIPFHFGPVRWIFFQKSLKSFFLAKNPSHEISYGNVLLDNLIDRNINFEFFKTLLE